MLDDINVIKQRDRSDALGVTARQYQQTTFNVVLENTEHDGRELTNIIIAGMGGSALAADAVKVLLAGDLTVPIEVIKGYDLPKYAGHNSLVIASSNSGNTEETLSCLQQAIDRGCQIAITTTGGQLAVSAQQHDILLASFPNDTQPRMGVIYNLRAILTILESFGLCSHRLLDEIANASSWLESETSAWSKEVPLEKNYAKQLALLSAGKSAEFVGSSLTAPVAYKWKISWNENSKNLSFTNNFPEYNHNEFIGWTSHPIEKPYIIFDIRSSFEHPQTSKRFDLTDRLLSGLRPKSNSIWLQGNTPIEQFLWGWILADFVSVYLGILNGIDPTQVDLIEKFKKQLSDQ